MVDFIKVVCIIAGALFPVFLIKAMKAQDDEKTSKYTALSSISFGFIIFTLMGLL